MISQDMHGLYGAQMGGDGGIIVRVGKRYRLIVQKNLLSMANYHSVPGKCPPPGKRPCTSFQGVNIAASIQMYGNYVPGKHPCGPNSGHYSNFLSRKYFVLHYSLHKVERI